MVERRRFVRVNVSPRRALAISMPAQVLPINVSGMLHKIENQCRAVTRRLACPLAIACSA
jgi:hypothetical protein